LGSVPRARLPHRLDLGTVLEFGRRQGLEVPEDVIIFAIEAKDTTTFGESLTAELAQRVPAIVEEIAAEI
jgi:hydrogenase maturation protease